MVTSHEHYIKFSSAFFVLIFVAGLLVGGVAIGYLAYRQISSLQTDVSNLKAQISRSWGNQTVTYQNITVYQNNTTLTKLYEQVRDSVVLIRGFASNGSGKEGSGFVYNFSGAMVIITNYHVVHGTVSLSVTFSNGNGYEAKINGTDPYADLAAITVDAPQSEFKPLKVASSSTLRVGDSVIAIGNPYGLVGSLTTGIISALGRTITEEAYAGRFAIANMIQTSALVNPGNSGGPLLNYNGTVVGITTAIIEQSQGLAFAVPSNTILREIYSLATSGSYSGHSYMGVSGNDMSYEKAQELGVNVTYGWWSAEVIVGGPAYNAGMHPGDIIIGMNVTKIRNMDEMSSYLEEYTLPGETLVLQVIRKGTTLQKLEIPVVLGTRPPPPV